MASFHNVTNEKSSDFEDADYDPDLEARLYAEIYYTNENYQQDYDTTDNSTENLGTNLTSTNSDAATNSKENFVNDTNRSKVSEKSSNQTSTYPSRSWVFRGGSNNARNDSGQQIVGPKHGKQQRLLAHKDLWLTRGQPEAQRNFGAAVQNLDDLPLETRLSEAETFATAVRRSKEISNLSTPLRNRSVENSNIATVVNRPNEAGNVSTQFAGGSINCENTSTVSNRRNVADEFSIQLRSGTTVSRSNEAGNFPTQLASGSINCENTSTTLNRPNVADDFSLQLRSGTTVNRSNEAGNLPTQFAGRSINCQNTSIGLNRPNVADDFSLQLRSGTAVNRSNEAGNLPTQFAGRSINCQNTSIGLNRPNIVDDFSIQLRSGITVNRSNEAGNFPTQFAGRSITCQNTSIGLNRPNIVDDFSIQLRSGITVNRSNEAGNFPTQFAGGSINCGNISIGLNRPNIVDDFSIQLRSGTTVNRSNETQNINQQFGGGAIYSDNLASFSNCNVARNNSLPLDSGVIEVENIRPARNRFNEARNFSTPFRSGAIDQNIRTSAGNRFNKPRNASAPCRSGMIDYCNIAPVLNHSEISSPQFGRKKANQNSRTIVTRSKTTGNRKSNVDRAERFVADSLEADFEAEELFSSYLAHQVRNFRQGSETELINLFQNAEITDNIVARDYLSLLKSQRKKELILRRQAERRRYQEELKQYLNNANVIMDGKYKVMRSKKNKLKMREIEPEPVDISSDSDDSILEVPVPPKTPPPVIQLQDSDDDFDDDNEKSSKSPSKKGRKTNADESSTNQSEGNDSSKDDESSAVPTCENNPKISRQTARKTKNTEHSVASSNIQQECEDDSGKSSKNRQKKGNKSVEENREESAASRISEPDFTAESSAEPIAESSLTIPQKISRETPKKMKNAENFAATPNIQESEDDSGKSSKNRLKRVKKSAEENREDSAVSRISEPDFPAESSAEPIAESSLTMPQKISRETPKKMKNAENSVATPNIQESEDDFGKSSKNRPKRGKKWAEENREDSAVSRISEVDSLVESSAEPIAESSSTIPQKISRETPKKMKNAENSVATPNIQESEDDSGKSSKNRPKKGKKSAEENREDSAVSRILETDSLVESSAEPIAESSSTISQKISRETPKKTKNTENSVATPNIQECENDSGKSSKNRPKKGKKSAEEPREDSAVSRILETDSVVESSAEPVAETSSTIPQKISRDTPKKTKNVESSVSTSNEQECEDDSGKSSKSKTKKGKKSAEEPREDITTSQILESSSNDNESFAANREAKLQKILKDAAKKTRDSEISAAVPNSEDGNLILNCTEIQKGASSLEEIRKMREAANLIHAQSDDSMTESEANNWVNIAAGQANSSRKDNEICSTASSIDGVNPALWNQSTQENRVATAEASKEIEVQSVDDFLPIETTSKSTGGDFNAPMTNPETANSRKRQKASSPFKDFDVPAIPEKRLKNRQKTSREQTMTEYFFKPMSKELQAFYNNPWGGENLDICDVQSRMPKNPNCWAILDADLQGPTSKRRRLCPRCKTDSHYGKRCPEKAKAPSCYMCGEKGHTESRCPHTMCLTCGRKYATYRPTCGHCSHLHCAMCNGSGHTHVDCPDLWRRYHNTTTSTPPVIPKYAPNIMKPAQHLSCCNCAKRGHDVTMCRQLRWSQHFPTPMYISSYTAGPMYEPSNIPSTQQPLNNDLTDEASRHERYFDTDSNNLQMPELSQNEFLEETSIDSSIETIDILDDSPPPEPEISLSQAQILFQAGENDPKKTFRWYKSQRRIDTVENIDLTGILSGNVKPNFLINWQPYLPFHVEIIHDTVEGTFMGIKCATTRIFTAFEKVIFQWLSRTDAEKAYLVYDKKPYEISNDLIEDIKKKLILSRSVLPVVSLLRKISIADKTVKQTAANYKQTQSKKNRRRITSMTSQFGISANRRSQLITSLYRGNYVEKGDILLQRFRCLARERLRRCNSGKHLATREYFEFVWTYNEIFTFHKTEELTKAFDKAIASFLAENSMDSETQNEILKFPKAEVIEIQSTTGKDNFLAAKISEITNNSAVDTLAESLPLLANPAANCAANIDPQLAPEFSKINEDVSNYSEQVSTANTEITTNEGTQNPGGSSSGILMQSLGKKGRRTYRRLAKAAIKAANTSNVPRLQKIAKALKTKMANGTILTDEIDFLQREITIDLRRRRGIDGRNLALKKFGGARKRKRIGKRQEQRQGQNNQQSQQKGTSDDNPAYVNVHGNL